MYGQKLMGIGPGMNEHPLSDPMNVLWNWARKNRILGAFTIILKRNGKRNSHTLIRKARELLL